MTGMVQTDLAHPTAPKYKDEPVEDPVSLSFLLFATSSMNCIVQGLPRCCIMSRGHLSALCRTRSSLAA